MLLVEFKNEQTMETIKRTTNNVFDFQIDNKSHHEEQKFF